MTEEKVAADRQSWHFTFGYGHAYPNQYVTFHGVWMEARTAMLRAFGQAWSCQYDDSELARYVEAYGWTKHELTDEELTRDLRAF